TSLRPETTPATTLCSSPLGWPSATTDWPSASFDGSPSTSGVSPFASILTRARSALRSLAWTETTSYSLPSLVSTVTARPSPMTCWLVATRPSARMTKPVPTDSGLPSRPRVRMTTTDGLTRRASSSTEDSRFAESGGGAAAGRGVAMAQRTRTIQRRDMGGPVRRGGGRGLLLPAGGGGGGLDWGG